MAPPLPYIVFALGEAQLHQLHTHLGKVCCQLISIRLMRWRRNTLKRDVFVMGEVAVELFQETPTAFLSELRNGKYFKKHSTKAEVLASALELGLPLESAAGNGITLLPPETVEELLTNKRRHDLVQPFKLGLLKLESHETARLLASGQYELALPAARDAVNQGEALFKPAPALQMFPLYLLAAQANLGLRRATECEKFLGLACWLVTKFPSQTTNVMSSQLNRLYGQMHALKNRYDKALEAFAQDIFCCSQEHGPLDVRTSLGYYNMGKVFEASAEQSKSLANYAMVVRIWLNALVQTVLGAEPWELSARLDKDSTGRCRLPLATLQLIEVIDMLADISQVTKDSDRTTAAKSSLAAGLVWAHVGEPTQAKSMLTRAESMDCKEIQYTDILQRAKNAVGVARPMGLST